MKCLNAFREKEVAFPEKRLNISQLTIYNLNWKNNRDPADIEYEFIYFNLISKPTNTL